MAAQGKLFLVSNLIFLRRSFVHRAGIDLWFDGGRILLINLPCQGKVNIDLCKAIWSINRIPVDDENCDRFGRERTL
jgi:hypothetical protein